MMSGYNKEAQEPGHVAESMATLETLNQKIQAEPTEEEKPTSTATLALASTSGHASVAKQQIPKTDQEAGELVMDEGHVPVHPNANSAAPRNAMKIFPDDVKWTPAMIFDWDLEDEDKESISSDDTASEANTEVITISDSDA